MVTRYQPRTNKALRGQWATTSRLEQSLDVDIGNLCFAESQQVVWTKLEETGNQPVWELFDADIILIDYFIVEFAAVGDSVFQIGDPHLQMTE